MVSGPNGSEWFEDYAEGQDELGVVDYDLSVTPNDFNISTLFDFIESRAVIIPGFQRNYVWDIGRASRLIESLILGLPVPQLYLYEEARNRFLVIDGQQRLMSVYYFIKQRFPRKEVRTDLRNIFKEEGSIPRDVLQDNKYFTDFRLQLPERLPKQPSPLRGLSYATMGEHKFQFDLRPIRNIVVKQNSPKDDDSSIYEIFSRLNSGGVSLTPQEIRSSLYHSDFYDMLMELNTDERWRRILGGRESDLRLKDVEVLLRIFALLIDSDNYAPSMVKFLNQFSRKCQTQDAEKNQYIKDLLHSFLDAADGLPPDAFINKSTNRFNIALIEAVFTAACYKAFEEKRPVRGRLDAAALRKLEMDKQFVEAASLATTSTANVRIRLERGRQFIEAL